MNKIFQIIKEPFFLIFFIGGILFAFIYIQVEKKNKIAILIKNLYVSILYLISIIFLIYTFMGIGPSLFMMLDNGILFSFASLLCLFIFLGGIIYLSISFIKEIKKQRKNK